MSMTEINPDKATVAAQERWQNIKSKYQGEINLIEVHSDGGIEFAIKMGGHWVHWAINPQGDKAVMLG